MAYRKKAGDFYRLPVRRDGGNERVFLTKKAVRPADIRQFDAPFTRQRGAQDDCRTLQRVQQPDKFPQKNARIRIVTVHLIQNHHFTGQAKGAHCGMPHTHDGHKSLIDCSNGKRRENATSAAFKPRAAGRGILPHVLFQKAFQPGIAMRQHCASGLSPVFKNSLQKGIDPVVNLVGGQLSGQGKIHAACLPFFQQAVCGVQGRFRFAEAHRGLKNIFSRPGDLLKEGLLNRVWGKGKNVAEPEPLAHTRRAKSGRIHSLFHQRTPVSLRVIKHVAGCDPVGRDGQPCQHKRLIRSIDDRPGSAFHKTRDQIFPCGFPTPAAK